MSVSSPEELQAPTFAHGALQKEEAPFVDYFGFSRTNRFQLSGGQYIEFRAMNEGEKKKFQDKTSRDLVVERGSGNARMTVLQGSERHELLKACITGWNLMRRDPSSGQPVPVPFDGRNLHEFLDKADPVIVEELEKEVRKINPWLLDNMSVEDIDREIKNLQEMREAAVKRQEGEEL